MNQAKQTTSTGFFKRHQWRLILIGALIPIVGVLAWRYYDSRYPSWYEEVRLSDGRIITIHQKREYYENYGTSQSWVTIDLPELGGKRVWHSYLMPQRVDVVDGKVYVFGVPRGDRQYAYYRDPRNFIVGFMWDGNGFARIPFLQIPPSIRLEENTYPCLLIKRSNVLSIDTKNAQWCEPMGDEKQFTKQINLTEYQAIAVRYSRRSGGSPVTE